MNGDILKRALKHAAALADEYHAEERRKREASAARRKAKNVEHQQAHRDRARLAREAAIAEARAGGEHSATYRQGKQIVSVRLNCIQCATPIEQPRPNKVFCSNDCRVRFTRAIGPIRRLYEI